MLKEWGKTRTDLLTIQESPLGSPELSPSPSDAASSTPVITV
jgi:hypothetical protein